MDPPRRRSDPPRRRSPVFSSPRRRPPPASPPCPFRPPSGVLTRPWPRPTPHLAIPALVAAFAFALLTCTIGSCAKLSALLPRQQHMALLSSLVPPSLSQQAWTTSSLASEPSWMLGLAASMGSMCCQPLREHRWLRAVWCDSGSIPGRADAPVGASSSSRRSSASCRCEAPAPQP